MFKEMSKKFHYLKLHLNHKAKGLKADKIIELILRKHKNHLSPVRQKLYLAVRTRLDTNKAIDIDKQTAANNRGADQTGCSN